MGEGVLNRHRTGAFDRVGPWESLFWVGGDSSLDVREGGGAAVVCAGGQPEPQAPWRARVLAWERVVRCGGLLSALDPAIASKHLDRGHRERCYKLVSLLHLRRRKKGSNHSLDSDEGWRVFQQGFWAGSAIEMPIVAIAPVAANRRTTPPEGENDDRWRDGLLRPDRERNFEEAPLRFGLSARSRWPAEPRPARALAAVSTPRAGATASHCRRLQ